jgi:hypothetical protein
MDYFIDGVLQHISIVFIAGPALELYTRIGKYFRCQRRVVSDTLICRHAQATEHDSVESVGSD